MSEGPTGRGRAASASGGRLPDFGSAGLTRGDVTVHLSPVQGPEHHAALTTAIHRIRGVAGTSTQSLSGGDLLLTVHVTRPVTLASELRRVLHRGMVSCTVRDGRFEVELARASFRVPEGPPPRPADVALPGPIAAVTRPVRPQPTAPAPIDRGAPALDVMVGALQSMTDVSILVFDADMRYRAVTGTAHEQHGYAPDHLLGRRADEALTERDWDRFRAAYVAALAGATTVLEFDVADGESLYEYTCSPVLNGTVVVGGMVVTRDVTERRRDQMLITELKEVFELTFDHSPICQALLSPAGQWLRVNAALRELLGRTEPSLVGRDSRELTHPEDRPTEEALMRDLVEGRRVRYALQKRLLHADGGPIPVHLRMSAVRGEGGGIRGLIAQVLDADALSRPATPRGPWDEPRAMH